MPASSLKWLWPDPKPSADELRLILLLGTAFLVSRYDFTLLTLLLPDIQRDFRVAEGDIGALVAYARLGAVAALPLAILADSMGRRRLLLTMIVGFSFSSVGCAFATDWRVFAFLQFIGRAFTAADEMISVVVVVEEVILKRRGWAVGLLSAFGVLGDGIAAICYPLTAYLPGGWRALYALAAAPLVVLVWMRRSLKETGSFEHVRAATGVGWRLTGKMMAARPAKLAALLLVTTAYYFPVSASLSLTSKFLQEAHNYSRANVSLLFIGVGIFSLAGNLFGGAVLDKLGRRVSFALFCVLTYAGFCLFYAGPKWAIPIAWALASFAFTGSHAVFVTISGEAFPTISRTTVATLLTAIGALSTAVGLVVAGALSAVLGNYGLAILTIIPFYCIAGVLALFLLTEPEGEKQRSASSAPTG